MDKQHGGSRPPIRKDDGRLNRKMVNPVKVTITIEKTHLDALKEIYGSNPHGHNWQDTIRSLVEYCLIQNEKDAA